MKLPEQYGTFHIIGIGGIGMSAIAEVLLARGFSVQGSDQADGANVQRLRGLGVRAFVGHDPANLTGADVVVYSTAVKAGNPEYDAALAAGMSVISRADMLAELMREKATISVTGTHGKTTTTSLIAHLFEASQADPTVISGGIINAWRSNARVGQGPHMVVEADESDGTFIRLPTQIGVVTNMDPEHLDYYGSVDAMNAAYETFLAQIPFYGVGICCIDHPVVRALVDKLRTRANGCKLITYGVSEDADLRLTRLSSDVRGINFSMTVSDRVAGGARQLDGVTMTLPGHYNALNCMAAFAVATEAGLTDTQIRSGLSGFAGVARRFTFTGEYNGVVFFDDYAHHPVEIASVLRAARETATGRVIAIKQPHRFTRLHSLFDDFAASMGDADVVLLMPVYTAGEAPIDGIDHKTLAEKIEANGHRGVLALERDEDVIEAIGRLCQPGDLVIGLGAGSITQWSHALPQRLVERDAAIANVRNGQVA